METSPGGRESRGIPGRTAPGDGQEAPPSGDDPARSLLSVVVPCLDEEAVVAETHRRLVAVLETVPDFDFELVYVDDGSRDATLEHLREFQRTDPRVRVLVLARNFGSELAMTAGLAEAAGDVVALMDADLQDPPEVILEMLDRWRQGAVIAYGLRSERAGENRYKRWTSKVFYRLMRCIADVPIPLDAGDFRVMDRRAVEALLAMPERDRFTRGLVAWTGFRQDPVPYRRHPRLAGRTKFPFRKLLRLAVDGILSFSLLPLRLAIWIGFLAAGLALSGVVYALLVRLFTDTWVSGWAALFIAVSFLGGVQLVLIGVLGEYLGRIYGEVKRRPLYFVKERLGFASAEPRGVFGAKPAARPRPATSCTAPAGRATARDDPPR